MPPTDIEDDEEELQEQDSDAPVGNSKIVLWLVMGGLAVLFLPLYVISTTVKSTNTKLTTQVENIQATLSSIPPVAPLQKTLSAQYLDTQTQSQAVGSIRSTLMASYINWPKIMAAIGAYNPNQLTVTNVDQIEAGIRITGRADQEIVAMAYADMLRASSLFQTVNVESINLQTVLITVTPSNTAIPVAEATPDANPSVTLTPLPTTEIKVTDFIISVTIKKETATDGRSS